MSNVLKMLSRGGAAAAETDPNFNQTVLLLHGDGTNGAQNNTFLDSSTNNFTITRNGNTTQGTFSPFSVGAGEWSNFFDGNGDNLKAPAGSAFQWGTGAFTIEAWIYPTVSGVYQRIWAQTVSGTDYFVFRISNTNKLEFIFATSGTGTQISSSGSLSFNTWTHIAVVREGTSSNQLKLYINGSNDGTGTCSQDFTDTTYVPTIGTYSHTSSFEQYTGYISNLRAVKGSAVYTSNFTPPTAPLTAITNTSLLTCQSNRFVDNSTNAFAITRNGDVRVTPFSPFAPTAAYSAGTNGGSGYFDGSGDYLDAGNQTAHNFDGQFTVEAWVYRTVGSTNQAIAGKWALNNGAWLILIGSGNTITFYYEASNITTTATIPLNAWCHIAVTRDSSNDIRIFVDGVQTGSTTNDSVNITSTSNLTIGAYNSTGSITAYLTGYIAGLRVLKGTAQYTSNFTPPTAPLTAITNTQLLLNFTNAGIIDNTGKNNLETVGNAQIDTAVKKFGTGSLEFDGSGDYLLIPDSPEWQLGGGDFTIEAWINTPDVTPSKAEWIVSQWLSDTQNSWGVRLETTGELRFWYATAGNTASNIAATTPGISNNTWTHIAVVRNGSTVTIYVDGVSKGSGSVSGVTLHNSTASVVVGGQANTGLGQTFTGYIDDLRITKGVARYTANFTPPTKEFPDL